MGNKKATAFKAEESIRYGNIAIVRKGNAIGILNVVTGIMVVKLSEYGSDAFAQEEYGYIVISDKQYGRVTVYDVQNDEMVIENYILSGRYRNLYIVQDPNTNKYYRVYLPELRRRKGKLQGPYANMKFLDGIDEDTIPVIDASKENGKRALYSIDKRITDFNIKEVKAYGNVIVWSDGEHEFFMSARGYKRFKKSEPFKKISIERFKNTVVDTQVLTCKNDGNIKIYDVNPVDTALLFDKNCEGASVIDARELGMGVVQFEMVYNNAYAQGLSVARAAGTPKNVQRNDVVPAERNIQLEKINHGATYVIGGREVVDPATAVAKGDVANGVGLEDVHSISAGRYYFGRRSDGYNVIAEIKDNDIKTLLTFEFISGIWFIKKTDGSQDAVILSEESGKKVITTVQNDKISSSKPYDSIEPLRTSDNGDDIYFLATENGRKCLLINDVEVSNFKCYDQNTGLESVDPQPNDIFLADTKYGCTLIMNYKIVPIPQTILKDLKNVTFGEQAVVLTFTDQTSVIRYDDVKPIIYFDSRKNLTPEIIHLDDAECELYKDEKGIWWGKGDNQQNPIEYFVENAAFIRHGNRKKLVTGGEQ